MSYKSIFSTDLDNFDNSFSNNKLSHASARALSKTAMEDVVFCAENAKKMTQKFSLEIPTMSVCNQKSSGRCWLFAALNVLREKVAKDLNLDSFELSQNYMSFYDKLEKANYFLESIIETAAKPTDDRFVNWLLKMPVGDGGQWDMFVGICKKYGVVPKDAMPETYQSSNTFSMNRIINMKLRCDAEALRKAVNCGETAESVEKLKINMLNEIYNVLASCLGQPPKSFTFEYIDRDHNYHADYNLTPKAFYDKYVGVDLDNFVSVINAPTETKPFNKTYTVDHLGSVIEADPIKYLNLPMERLKELVVNQLKNGELVWFGCDTGKYGNKTEGIWDTAIYDYESTFSLSLEMEKGNMLDYAMSAMGHAMVITGVNIVDGKTEKWKIENSWGDEKGRKGYFIISDAWFDKFVYEACIDKKYLSDNEKSVLNEEPVVLPPWDPMGTLA